jgi:hypothetical protein
MMSSRNQRNENGELINEPGWRIPNAEKDTYEASASREDFASVVPVMFFHQDPTKSSYRDL